MSTLGARRSPACQHVAGEKEKSAIDGRAVTFPPKAILKSEILTACRELEGSCIEVPFPSETMALTAELLTEELPVPASSASTLMMSSLCAEPPSSSEPCSCSGLRATASRQCSERLRRRAMFERRYESQRT
mgnify:CR=1 FL=1